MSNKQNIGKSTAHRAFVRAKLHCRRVLNIGSNMSAVHTIGQFIRKLLGMCITFVRMIVQLIYIAVIVLGEALSSPAHAVVNFIGARGAKLEHTITTRTEARKLAGTKTKLHRTSLCAFLATATILICSGSYFGIGLEITIDGQPVGYIDSREQLDAIITDVEQRTSGYLGRPYNLSLDLDYSLGYVQRDNLLNTDYVKELLFSKVNEVSTQYVLSVDGQLVGANSSKTSLELLKQRILSSRTDFSGNTRAEFVQDIAIEQRPVANTFVKTIPEIENALVHGTRDSMMYAVQQGDTLGRIAQTYGMTLEQVYGLNPNIDPASISAGTTLRVASGPPLLSVKTTTKIEYTQEIAYETEVVQSDELYENQTKIQTPGTVGVAAVTADLISIDGVEQNRTIQAWNIVNQPQTEVKLVGTKEPPPKAATGKFILPFHGMKSSSYGYRSRGFHTGVDLAGVKGSPVVAADGGTVIQAGWNGSYGYSVMIDHGNGMVTLYAHNSSLVVKKGQRIAQGEKIANLGSTGNSTGPHCHWEVRINGKTVNPLNYLK